MRRRLLRPIALAVISDLHVGAGARSKDFSPDPDHAARDDAYRDSFLNFVKNNNLRADYLVVPGDVSHRGAPQEFQLASAIIEDCARALHVAPASIVFVPGNHDADWTVFQAPDTTGFRQGQKFAPLQNPQWLFEKIMGNANRHLLKDNDSYSAWEYDNFLAVGYNSAWDDKPGVPVHHGFISNSHLDALERHLTSLDLGPHRLRLFIVHHHPVVYSDPLPNEPDFSAMTNAPRLLSILRDHHFDLLIHGHRHSPVFQTIAVDSQFPIAILSAGSFSAELDGRWSGLVNNQFHIIRIEGRDKQDDCIFGNVCSWTYLAQHGWLPSKPHNGIRHVIPFGTYLQPSRFHGTLQRMIKAALGRSDYVSWTALIATTPRFKYLPPQLVYQTLDQLRKQVGFSYIEDSQGLILFKDREDK
jgi:UDP-2,3-diacylglucosamine pyrophosphatase LpxH